MTAWRTYKPIVDVKTCPDCGRIVSHDDAHKRCQKCRNGGAWPNRAEYMREYGKRRRANHAD